MLIGCPVELKRRQVSMLEESFASPSTAFNTGRISWARREQAMAIHSSQLVETDLVVNKSQLTCRVIIYLVGGLNPSEKYESQLGWWNSQYIGTYKMATKPPTSFL